MKRFLALSLAALTAVSLTTSCGNKKDKKSWADQVIGDIQDQQAQQLSPDEYLDYLLIDNENISKVIRNTFDTIKPSNGSGAGSSKITIAPGDGLVNFLNAIDTDFGQTYKNNMSWFKDLSLSFDSNVQNNDLIKLVAGLGLNSTSIATLDFTASLNSGKFYLAIPELSSKTLYIEAPGDYYNPMSMSTSMLNIYPDGATAERMYKKYAAIVLDNIYVDAKTDTQLTAAGVTAPASVMNIVLDEKMAAEIAADVVEAAISDPDIKNFITNVAESVPSYDSTDEIVAEAYEGMNEALQDLKEDIAEGNFSSEKIYLDIYTNNSSEITGIVLRNDSTEYLRYVYAEAGGRFAEEFTLDNQKYLSGTGTVQGSILAGNYDILDGYGTSLVTVNLSKLDKSALKAGRLDCSATVKLSSTLISDLDLPAFAGYCDIRLDIRESNDSSSNISVTFNYNNAKVASVSLDTSKKAATPISLPTNAINVNSPDAAQKFMSSLNLNNIYSRLNDAGASQLTSLIQLAMMSMY